MPDRRKEQENLLRTNRETTGDNPLNANTNKHPENLNQIYQQYPGVPDPYPLAWDKSDRELPQDLAWQKMLKATATALCRGAEVCEHLSAKHGRTTCSGLVQDKNTLLCAIHKAEDLVSELTLNYPLPISGNYRVARENPDLAARIPALLHNDASRILIWMPTLPSKKRGSNSLIFSELQEMLQVNHFTHLDQWHCDFIHIYHPNNLAGILDVDNYSYKPVIDALTLALASQDSFDHFSFSAYNLPHLTLKPGCYIHICKREEKVPFFQFFEEMISGAQSL